MPEEINRLGRTIATWRTQISNWHAARVTNAPTEAANNLIKRVKRTVLRLSSTRRWCRELNQLWQALGLI